MDTKQTLLYQKILAFEFDDPETTRTFVSRLEEANGWSADFAARALLEYRRFLFLAMVTGHTVCPSDEVDEVWHLHLQYTRQYWQTLCRDVLGRPLHHEPSRGGADECAKHRQMYTATLRSYRQIFGEQPPADLWPGVDARFAFRTPERSVDPHRYWLIPKPIGWRTARRRSRFFGAGLATLSLAVAPVSFFGAINNPWDWPGPRFLALYVPLVAVAFLLAYLIRQWARVKDPLSPSATPALDSYDMAYLAGGQGRTINAAVASLVNAKALMMVADAPPRFRQREPLPPESHELERFAYASFSRSEKGDVLRAAHRVAAKALEPTREKLRELGLIVSQQNNRLGVGLALVTMALVLIFGGVKILVGLDRHRPVTYLMFICVPTAIVSAFAFGRPLHRTPLGDRHLAALREQFTELRSGTPFKNANVHLGPVASSQLATAVGLFGFGLLADSPLSDFERALRRTSGGATGCGGGAACGGGCGGGGCGGGGCGGCGG